VPVLDLIVLGDCNPDLVLQGDDVDAKFGQAERIVERAELTIGGSGAIAACGAARLGLRTGLVSVVGDDTLGHFMLGELRARNVDLSGVVVDSSIATGISVVLVNRDDRATLTALGSISSLTAAHVDRDLLRSARHVHVSSFFLQHGLRPGLPSLLREAHAANATTSLDPNWDPAEAWNSGIGAALAETDVLLLNQQEVVRITGLEDVEQAARELSRGGTMVVVKRGPEGALAVEGDDLVTAPARPIRGVDAVGAGDSFDAGFIAGLLDGRPLPERLAFANVCGALSMRAPGGTAAQPTLAEAMAG
jgi:sugar/nucleoside kinase (ribokinase family)